MAIIYGITDSERNLLDKMPKEVETLKDISRVRTEFEEKIEKKGGGFFRGIRKWNYKRQIKKIDKARRSPLNSGTKGENQVILQDNLQQLANFIVDKKKDFDFVIPKMNLSRNDNVELRNKILNMTPEERKLLGINKSTLFYVKNNIKKDKNIRFYRKVLEKLN